jgi:hypothetical protein
LRWEKPKNVQSPIISGSLFTLLLAALTIHVRGRNNFDPQVLALTGQDNLHRSNPDLGKIARVDSTKLLDGGPPKDGIPSIDSPRFPSTTAFAFVYPAFFE